MGNKVLIPTKTIVIDDKTEKDLKNRFPYNNQRLIDLGQTYGLSSANLREIYSIFQKLDVNYTGYITKNDFGSLWNEKPHSPVLIYSDFLFDLIKKQIDDRMDFFEWLVGILEFGLANEEQLLRFVFRIIDSNNDQKISLKNLYEFLGTKRNGRYSFPVNIGQLLSGVNIAQEFIGFSEFKEFHDKLFFLMHPAIVLNERIQENIIGYLFWNG